LEASSSHLLVLVCGVEAEWHLTLLYHIHGPCQSKLQLKRCGKCVTFYPVGSRSKFLDTMQNYNMPPSSETGPSAVRGIIFFQKNLTFPDISKTEIANDIIGYLIYS
jgi:hypothetical protein